MPLRAAATAAFALFALTVAPAAFTHPAPLELRVMTLNIWYRGEPVNFASGAAAIRAANADVVGVQEPDGNLYRLADAVGFAHVDPRRNLISRYPLFDSGVGRRTDSGLIPASITALDASRLHAWVMVRPGEVVAIANTHLPSDPYGPEAIRDGATVDAVIELERRVRVPPVEPFLAMPNALKDVPVFLTGDFNTPSHLDWSSAMQAVRPTVIREPIVWPVTQRLAEAGWRDSFREVHADPARKPGYTWTAGMPHPYVRPQETIDRIDFVFASGPADAVRSEIVGETGGDGVDISLTPYPSDHRGVVSTFRVVPAAAPAVVSIEPRTIARGADLLVRGFDPQSEGWRVAIVPADAAPDKAMIKIVENVAAWRRAARLSSRTLLPGEYDAVLLDARESELTRSRFVIRDPAAPINLQPVSTRVRGGEPVRVRWSNGTGHRHDSIGLFRAGAPMGAALSVAYLDTRYAGEVSLPTVENGEPLPAGSYELRFLRDDSQTVEASAWFDIR
ncbi:MAG: endonuclease/exonuclease/phosphatase family protein [Nevskiaceae bacterium]